MAKANITQYSSTPSSNTDINNINIDENCPASGLNNAIRELMAHLKNVDTGSQALTALSVTGDLTVDTSTLKVDSTNNRVGIGNASPATTLDVLGDNLLATFSGTDTASTYLSFKYNTSTLSAFIGNGSSVLSGANNSDFIIRSQGDLVFASNGNNRRVTIDSSGNLLVGCTGLPSGGGGGAGFETGQSNGRTILQLGTTTTSQETLQRFYNPNGNVGEIKTSGSSTSYVTTSDHRLKENVTADWDATTRLKQLNPVRFNFISDADTTVDGFLAHEVQSVVPEAITGTHNEVDDDGNPVYQGIDQSKLVPLLVKTIQELEARITALENA